MLTIQLDPSREERLRALAAAQGRDIAEVARFVLEDYLDIQADAGNDTPEKWAEASASMVGEFYSAGTWPEHEQDDDRR